MTPRDENARRTGINVSGELDELVGREENYGRLVAYRRINADYERFVVAYQRTGGYSTAIADLTEDTLEDVEDVKPARLGRTAATRMDNRTIADAIEARLEVLR